MPPNDICLGCGKRRRCGAADPCARCGAPPHRAVWRRSEQHGASPKIELFLSAITSCLLLAYTALYMLLLTGLAGSADGSLAGAALFAAILALSVKLSRWIVRSLFELWGTTWAYCSADGARWGTVSTLFGWYGAGEGVCLEEFEPTSAGSTLFCSSDAIEAGLPVVAANLSRIAGARGGDAFSPFEVLMLSAFTGLVARGEATISRATAVRWRKDWLGVARRGAPHTVFTIERASDREEGSALEREILSALQAKADGLAPIAEPARPGGYRDAARRPPPVRLRIEEVLRPRALALAARALRKEPRGGAPVAVAAALDEFGKRDPARLSHLRTLLAEHPRGPLSA
ncbi:hypothetical protein WME76_14900 [Sorangium sp. So ce119]|uniref:hypothetical protein n=1 Tax=Sorangium sp. So ce119 TaxID=3133279 RepID=UPI003F607867